MKLFIVLFLALAVLCVPKEPRHLRKNDEAAAPVAANDAQSPVWSKATNDNNAKDLCDGDHSSCTETIDDGDDDCPSDDDEDGGGETSSSIWAIADERDLVVEQEQPGEGHHSRLLEEKSMSSTAPFVDCCLTCPMCECHETKEELEQEIAELDGQIAALGQAMDWLDAKQQEIEAVMNSLLGEFDNFEVKIVGRCVLAGVEAAAVGNLALKSLKPVCVEVGFAAECISVGLKSKEVVQYLWKNRQVANAILAFGTETATVIAKTQVGDDGWVKYVPILGSWCEAYDWSSKLVNAPELIEMLGDQTLEALKLKLQFKNLKTEKEQEKVEKEAELKLLPCHDGAPP